MNLRPLGYETNDTHLLRPAASRCVSPDLPKGPSARLLRSAASPPFRGVSLATPLARPKPDLEVPSCPKRPRCGRTAARRHSFRIGVNGRQSRTRRRGGSASGRVAAYRRPHMPMSVRPLSRDMPVIERDDERRSGGPNGPVVGEVDHPGIELLEGIDPDRDVGQGLTVTITTGSPRELVGRVLRRRVVALPRHDHRPSGRRTISDW